MYTSFQGGFLSFVKFLLCTSQVHKVMQVYLIIDCTFVLFDLVYWPLSLKEAAFLKRQLLELGLDSAIIAQCSL
jgi:hypothetical protein